DLFSLGAVLYEMLAGRRAFQGPHPAESIYAVLNTDPEPLPPDVPLTVARVVLRCLEKEPARRFQSASDLAFALDALRRPTESAIRPIEPGPLGRRRAWARRALALAVAIVFGVLLVVRRPVQLRSSSAVLPEPEQITSRWGTVNAARFLPDGRVAYSAAFEGRPEEVFVRPSGSPTAQALGLVDTSLLGASSSGELAVLIHRHIALGILGTVARVPSVGGIPREVAENAELADWSPRGDLAIVHPSGQGHVLEFPPGHVLFRTAGWISRVRFSPAGERMALLHHPVPYDDMGEVVIVDFDGRFRTLTKRWPTSMGLAWSPDGTEVWFTAGVLRKNTVYAVTLSGHTRELYRGFNDLGLEDVAADGRALVRERLVRAEVAYRGASTSTETLLSWSDFNEPLSAVSADGKLLFSTLRPDPVSEGLQPSWVLLRSRDGSPAQVLGEGMALDLSADGRWALAMSDAGRKLTALPTGAGQPRSIPVNGLEVSVRGSRWAPDGKTILLTARPDGGDHVHLYRVAEDGSATRLSETGLFGMPFVEVSRDGRWAAALDEQLSTVVISLADGTARRLALTSRELVVPRGWSREGQLWVTEGGSSRQTRTRLLRVEPQSGRVLEERSVGPTEPGGVTQVDDVVLSADGSEVAFSYLRDLGKLYIVRGLGR
ncbi:MAG TPA: hypothetical protein VFF12_14930, partial [Myxococcaceae bacterium]|nr:hypothetical protein [Myxococcaceae bacterium]